MTTLLMIILTPVVLGFGLGLVVRGQSGPALWAAGGSAALLTHYLLTGASPELAGLLGAFGSFAILLMALLTLVGIEIGLVLKQRKAQTR